MDDVMYSFHSPASRSDDVVGVVSLPIEMEAEELDLVKSQIANHPLFPDLLAACAECRKIGAPPEMCSFLKEIVPENGVTVSSCSGKIGDDPELDKFMEVYCEVVRKMKTELLEVFDEATKFFIRMESELSDLCKETLTSSTYQSDEAAGSSEDDLSCGEVETAASEESSGTVAGDQELKGMLLRKYSGYLGKLRKEFLKKRKKGKLPKEARLVLLDWWNTHHRWPYPTEEEKANLSEVTGLDQKQISNWFINQRKRHWKLDEDMRYALMDGGCSEAPVFLEDAGGGSGNFNAAYTNN